MSDSILEIENADRFETRALMIQERSVGEKLLRLSEISAGGEKKESF